MMKKAVFITGTGTDVGKTVITAGMVRSLRQKGYNACPVKPVQTGCRKKDDDRLVAPDLEYSLKTADLSLKEKIKDFLCPCRYVHACSPHLAARFTGVYPDIRTIKESIAKAFLSFDILFIEGAGGILVPLTKEETMLDLIKALGFPVLLVAGAGLGTINHTLLSLDKLKKEAVPVLGVVFTQKEPYADEYIIKDNPKVINEFSGTPVLGELRFIKNISPENNPAWEIFKTDCAELIKTMEGLCNESR